MLLIAAAVNAGNVAKDATREIAASLQPASWSALVSDTQQSLIELEVYKSVIETGRHLQIAILYPKPAKIRQPTGLYVDIPEGTCTVDGNTVRIVITECNMGKFVDAAIQDLLKRIVDSFAELTASTLQCHLFMKYFQSNVVELRSLYALLFVLQYQSRVYPSGY